MNKPLHERLAALIDFLSPPSANALSPPGLELLTEAVKALTPPKDSEIAPSAVEMPWPNLPAGSRLVTSAYPRSVVSDYGNARAAERDAFWRDKVSELQDSSDVYRITLKKLLDGDMTLDALRDEIATYPERNS